MRSFCLQRGFLLSLGLLAGLGLRELQAATVIFSTGFDSFEGYSVAADLEDQQGWTGTGEDTEGDNGILEEAFEGFGQQAYVGFAPLAAGRTVLNVWRPINIAPVPTNTPVVKFSVLMAIVDSSTAAARDCFRWSIYNTNGTRLFSVDFDNDTREINYLLEGSSVFEFTGFEFEPNTIYELIVRMDYSRNLWSAELTGVEIVAGQPITRMGSPLNFGDADAVWAYGPSDLPGDNYMVFDEYEVSLEGATDPPQPTLTNFLRLSNGHFLLRVTGEPGRRYAVEGSTDFKQWTTIRTEVAEDGFFDFVDTDAPAFSHRFYRARLVE